MQKVTVITQFVTSDGTDTGDLVEIRRKYVQNGKVIRSPTVQINGKSYDSIGDDFCTDVKASFADPNNDFKRTGGMSSMGKSMDNGMVLVMSLWDDGAANMLWLDGAAFPTDQDPSKPGVARGPCATTSGKPADVEKDQTNASVSFSNIKTGPFCSTYADPEDKLCKSAEAAQKVQTALYV